MKRAPKRRAGFSLIEALIAVSIFGIALAAVVPSFIFNARTNRESQRRTEAVVVAQQYVDSLRQQDFGSWPETGATATQTVNGKSYQTVLTYCVGTLIHCGDGARHLKVEVKTDGKVYYQVETVYTAFE